MARVDVIEVEHLNFLFIPLEFLRRWIFSWPQWVISLLIYGVVLITIWSFFDYFGSFIWQQYVKKFKGDEAAARRGLRLLLPNAFTILNLLCGTVAVITASFGLFHTAVLLVILGILFDAIDGSLARKLNAYSQFGASLDSKADFISFGIAPAVVIFKIVSSQSEIHWFFVGGVLGFIYYASVQYRLWRFDKEGGHKSSFEGLPSPAGAAVVVIAAISGFLSHPIVFPGLVLLVSVLMISKVPYAHFAIASRKRFFKWLQVPAFIFFILTVINLLDLPYARNIFAYEILFGLTCIYVVSPIGLIFRGEAKQGE